MNFNKFKKHLSGRATLRGITAIVIFVIIWELGARSEQLLGYRLPFLGLVPPPTDVAVSWAGLIGEPSYWQSWYMSFLRVFGAFSRQSPSASLWDYLWRLTEPSMVWRFQPLRYCVRYRLLHGCPPRLFSGRPRNCLLHLLLSWVRSIPS